MAVRSMLIGRVRVSAGSPAPRVSVWVCAELLPDEYILYESELRDTTDGAHASREYGEGRARCTGVGDTTDT